MKRKITKILGVGLTLALLVSMLLTAAPVAAATTIYVPGDHTTIQLAIDAASAGDTIIVADGSYTENIVIDKSITLKSVNGAGTTTIQSSAEGIPVTIKADGVTVEGFTVTGCRTEAPYGEQGAGIYLEAVDDCIIKDNILTDNYPVGINLYGGAYGGTLLEYPDDNVVTGNVITGWRHETLGQGTSYGIKVKGTGNIISDNTISVANSAGIHVWSEDAEAVEASPPSGNVISGNTIFDVEDKTAHYRQMMAGIWFLSGDSNEISNNNIGAWVQAGIVLKDNGNWTWATASQGNVISGNTITAGTSIGGGWFGHKGIVLIGVVAGKPLADNSITGNTITGKAVGLSFVNSADNAVHYNNITGNTAGLENDTPTLDATNNWWGTIVETEIAAMISGSVTYDPWLGGAYSPTTVTMTSSFTPVIGISVEPASIDFESLIPGTPSLPETVIVTNEGNVAVDLTTSLTNISTPDVYTTGLGITWVPSASNVAIDGTAEASLVLTVPGGTAPGTYSATLVFWAEEAQ